MYSDLVDYKILEENANTNAEDSQKYIQEMMNIVTKRSRELETVHNEITKIMNHINNEELSKSLTQNAENEYKINYELINKLYYIKHKSKLPDDIDASLKNYCLLITFLREMTLQPDKYKQLIGDKYSEVEKVKKNLVKLLGADKETATKLSKEFILKMEDVVEKAEDPKIKESYYKLRSKLDSSIISEDVKLESVKDFLKDLYRLPYKVVMKPFAKMCYSFVIYAARIVNTLLKPFVTVINKVIYFFQTYLPKKLVEVLSKAGIIKNPLIGTMIEMGFKIAVPMGLNFGLFFFNMFSPRAFAITSFISTVMGLSRTVLSVNVATETVSSINQTLSFLSAFAI